jgi:GxxExxY protein
MSRRRCSTGWSSSHSRSLGPGFLERIYQEALCLELKARGVPFEAERLVYVSHRGVRIGRQRIDLIVAGCVIVELKATSAIDPRAEAN